MKKTLAVLGFLCAVAPLARADDVGVVTKFDGPFVTLHVGLNMLHVGEEVRLTVMPERRNGYGRAVVTDLDVNSHLMAVRLLPAGGSDTGAKNAATGTFHGNTRLFLDDTVRFTSLHTYTDNPPEYRVERPAYTPVPDNRDIEMPAGMPLIRLRSGSASAPTAAPSSAPSSRMPDVDSLLRSLGGGAAGGAVGVPDEAAPSASDVAPSRGRTAQPANGLFRVARLSVRGSAK
jgi:hypothetical protein